MSLSEYERGKYDGLRLAESMFCAYYKTDPEVAKRELQERITELERRA